MTHQKKTGSSDTAFLTNCLVTLLTIILILVATTS